MSDGYIACLLSCKPCEGCGQHIPKTRTYCEKCAPNATAGDGLRELPYVVDRDGHVWLVVRDGGMATRATASGVISAGISWLESTAGPLLPFAPAAYRRSYPRSLDA